MDLIPETFGGQQPSRLYPPRIKLLLLALGGAVFSLVGLVVSLSPITFVSWFGWALFLLCAVAALVIVVRALRPGPTLTIDSEGIVDRTSLAPIGRVRWDEISVLRKKEIGRGAGAERILEVVLVDRDAFLTRPRGLFGRVIDRYRLLLNFPLVSIPGSMVNMPMVKLIAELQQWRPELHVLELPPEPPRLLRRNRQSGKHPTVPRW